MPEKFGFDTRKVQFSSLILTGQMKREDAIKELAKPAYDPDMIHQDFESVASKLDWSTEHLMDCFKAPNKSYKDYAHQERVSDFGARILRVLGKELGGKR